METLVASVNRNDATLEFKNSAFNKNSKEHAGKIYPCPVILESNSESWLKFIGVSDLAGMVAAYMRRVAQDIFLSNLKDNEGVFDAAEFIADFEDFTAGAESMKALEEEIESLVALQQNLITDTAFGEVDSSGNATDKANEVQAKLKETAAQLRPLKVRLADVTEKNKAKGVKIAATRAANKAKKEAEAATAKASVTPTPVAA